MEDWVRFWFSTWTESRFAFWIFVSVWISAPSALICADCVSIVEFSSEICSFFALIFAFFGFFFFGLESSESSSKIKFPSISSGSSSTSSFFFASSEPKSRGFNSESSDFDVGWVVWLLSSVCSGIVSICFRMFSFSVRESERFSVNSFRDSVNSFSLESEYFSRNAFSDSGFDSFR